MTDPIDIRACGLICPAPGQLADAAPLILAGETFFERHPTLIGHDGLPQTGGFVPGCMAELDPAARLAWLLAAAHAATMANLPDDIPSDAQWALTVALPIWVQRVAAMRDTFRQRVADMQLPRVTQINYVFGGAAAGLAAYQAATKPLHDGTADFALVAGVDTLVAPPILDMRAIQGLANTQDNSYGVIPSEAGAMQLLQRAGSSLPLARLHTISLGQEAEQLNDPKRGIMGRALTKCLRDVMPRDKAAVGPLMSDYNGERHRGEELGVILSQFAQDGWAEPLCPAASIGDVGAATAATFAALVPYAPITGSQQVLMALGDRDGARAAARFAAI